MTKSEHILYDETGSPVECIQTGTIQRIYDLYTTLREDILTAIETNREDLLQLRRDLDERKIINNYTREEREWLLRRIEVIGDRTEEEDKSLAERVTNLEKAVVVIANNDTRQEKIQYLTFGAIVTFFVTFGYKTLILGI